MRYPMLTLLLTASNSVTCPENSWQTVVLVLTSMLSTFLFFGFIIWRISR